MTGINYFDWHSELFYLDDLDIGKGGMVGNWRLWMVWWSTTEWSFGDPDEPWKLGIFGGSFGPMKLEYYF